jgi:capsule polysaccharide export protein KpsE/RkpR
VALDSNAHLYEEVVRLREKMHDLTHRVNTLEVHTDGMRKTLDRVETKVDAISTADQIAEAVAQHDRSRNTLQLKPGQKAAILGAIGFIVAGVLRGLFGIEWTP